MATLSTAARNAAIDAIVALLLTGSIEPRPYVRSFDAEGTFIHSTYFATTPDGDVFEPASDGEAVKSVLPWSMPVTNASVRRELATWQLRDLDGTPQIVGTYGLTGSGADMEFDALGVLNGNSVRFSTFSLSIA